MGWFGGRKEEEPRPEQKWDAISLRDFKSSSCWTALAYGYLHFGILLSLAVYGVDTFTAVNLLAFNTWSSSVPPSQIIPFDVSKWIFSICIMASFINLGLEHIRSLRVRRRGNVAECYLDNLAVRMESIRWGRGQGWRRFLVFAELTKSKKGAEYVALFTYFSFQSWVRVIFCSGPRQVINAFTLYSIYSVELNPEDNSSVAKTLDGFFTNIKYLYEENNQQAVILSGMLFTLVIWVFAALFLLLAVLFYVFFLWHYIPRQDGGLKGYCERKVNKRLKTIVMSKINKALEKEEESLRRAGLRAARRTGEKPPIERQATLPHLMDPDNDDKLPGMPTLNRTETMSTLPAYTSRPTTPMQQGAAPFDVKRPMPARHGTHGSQLSVSSTSSNAPLMMNRIGSPAPADYNNNNSYNNANGGFPPPMRPATGSSARSFGSSRGSPASGRFPVTGPGFEIPRTGSPAVYSPDGLPPMPLPERVRSPAGGGGGGGGMDPYGNRPVPRQVAQLSGRPAGAHARQRSDESGSDFMSPTSAGYPGFPGYGGGSGSPGYPSSGRSATNPLPPMRQQQQQQFQPQRNATTPEYYAGGRGWRGNGNNGASYDRDIESQRGYQGY